MIILATDNNLEKLESTETVFSQIIIIIIIIIIFQILMCFNFKMVILFASLYAYLLILCACITYYVAYFCIIIKFDSTQHVFHNNSIVVYVFAAILVL